MSNSGTEMEGVGNRTVRITPLVHVSDGFKERISLDRIVGGMQKG